MKKIYDGSGWCLLAIVLLVSCRSVNKTHNETHLQSDSITVKKVESLQLKTIDTSKKISVDTSKTFIIDNGIKIQFQDDTTHSNSPITITRKNGETKVEVGTRKVKYIEEKSTKTKEQTNKQETTQQGITSQKDSSNIVDSSNVSKKIDTENNSKKTSHFSMLWLLWLIVPIIYFGGMYLYKKGKLPLSLSIAKFLLYA
jgi:ATP-dependent Zn protease